MAWLYCAVERLTHQNKANGYSVIKCRAKGYQDLITVLGRLTVDCRRKTTGACICSSEAKKIQRNGNEIVRLRATKKPEIEGGKAI